MDKRRNIISLLAAIICLLATFFFFGKQHISNSEEITKEIQAILSQSQQEIRKDQQYHDQASRLGYSQTLENQQRELYVFDSKDSILFWSGQTIPELEDDSWRYQVSLNRLCHQFSYQGQRHISCFHPSMKFHTNSKEHINHTSQITSIEKFSKPWQKNLSALLLVIASFLFLKILFSFLGERSKPRKDILVYVILILAIAATAGVYYYQPTIVHDLIKAPFFLLISSILFLCLQIIYLQRPAPNTSRLLLNAHAAATGILIAAFIKISESILIDEHSIDFEKIDLTSSDQLLFACWAIICIFGIWLFFRNAFLAVEEAWVDKLVKFGSLLIAYGATSYFVGINLPLLFALLFLAIYFLTADLFYEAKDPNVTWLIWWVILHAAFLSSNFYFTSVQNGIKQTKVYLENIYQQAEQSKCDSLMLFANNVDSSGLFSKMASLPVNAKLSENDIKSFINEKNAHADVNYAIYFFQASGDSGLLKNPIQFNEFQDNTRHYIRINDQLRFDPFSGRYLISFTSNPRFYILTAVARSADQYLKKYGVFVNNEFVYGELDRLPDFEVDKINRDTTITRNAVSHIFYSPNNSTLLYSKKTYASLLKPISIFSFIFCLSVFLLFIFAIFNSRYLILDNIPLFFKRIQSLRLRIQLVIIFLILLSFVTIAWVTSFYFNNILKKSKEKEITTKIVAINNSLQHSLQNVFDFQSAYNIVENEISKLSGINNTNAIFFGKNGFSNDEHQLLYPYYPFYTYVYDNMSKPLTKINEQDLVQAYFPLRNQNLGLIGFLSLEDSPERISQKDNLSDFLGSILNLYVFLFLIAGAIAIAVSRSITSPLTHLGKKIDSLKVGKKNEMIEWKSKDEIGELINSYNDMVQKLDLNIKLMAKTERDIAWREMAKQVAHEIKNPLTPMKLSIQYLIQAIKRSPERSEELIQKTSHTLIEQIENLSEIANAFSNVATLPQANNEKIVLNEVVEAVHDLFRKRDDLDIKLLEPLEEVLVFADKGNLVRILNNLVKNAIQAIPTDRHGYIEIKLYTQKELAIISVSDNGQGIPNELKEKIFTPKFTTKSSGSGLGLAIAANMIDAMNGRIYFESEEGKGTQFYLEIPLMRTSNPPQAPNRVSLDE